MAKWEIIEDNKFKKANGGKAAASPNGLTIKTPFSNLTPTQPVQEKSVIKSIPTTVKPQYKSEGDYLNQVYGEDSGVQLPGQSSILRANQDAEPVYDVAKKDYSSYNKDTEEQKIDEQVAKFLKANPLPESKSDKADYIENLSPYDRQLIQSSSYFNQFLPAFRQYQNRVGENAKKYSLKEAFSDPNKLSEVTQSSLNRFRLFPNATNSIEDFVNPGIWLGQMEQGVADIPKNIRDENYLGAAMGVVNPMLLGRTMGSGNINPLGKEFWTNEVSTPQFINNLVNPLAGIVENPLVNYAENNRFLPNINEIKQFSGIFKKPALPEFISNTEQELLHANRNIGKQIKEGILDIQDDVSAKEAIKFLNNVKNKSNLLTDDQFLRATGFEKNQIDNKIQEVLKKQEALKNIQSQKKNYTVLGEDEETIDLSRRFNLQRNSRANLRSYNLNNTLNNTLDNVNLNNYLTTPTEKPFVFKNFLEKLTSQPQVVDRGIIDHSLKPSLSAGKGVNPTKEIIKAVNEVRALDKGVTVNSAQSLSSDSKIAELRMLEKLLEEDAVSVNYHGMKDLNSMGFSQRTGIPSILNLKEINTYINNVNKLLPKNKKIPFATITENGQIWYPDISATRKKYGGIIEDPMGQWAHPGSVTRIPSNQITMKNVNYPVLGVSDKGHTQMMYPGEDYSFKGKSVTEYPMMAGGGEVNFTYAGENHRVYEKESPTGNGKGIEGHIMVNHPTENKKRWDTIDLTKITNGRVKTVPQGVASTKKWHKENPEYANGGQVSSWEIIEDLDEYKNGGLYRMQDAGKAPSFDDSDTTTDVPFDNKILSTSGDFSPEEIKKIKNFTRKESEDRIEYISNYFLLTPEQKKRYDEQKEIASYNDSLAKYEKAKTDWEKDKSYFTAPKDGIAFPSNYDDLSSFADYCDPWYSCSGAEGRGSTGLIRNGDYSYKIEYFTKPKLSKELEKKIKDRQLIQNNKDRQKQEEIKTTTSTDTKIPLTVITNTDEKTTPTVIEHSTVNGPDKRYFTVTSERLYRNPRTGAFEPKVYKADGVKGKRLTESYFESDLTDSGSTPVFTADNPSYYSNHPDIYKIRTDSSKTWNPETKKFESKTWLENKATGESVTDPSFSPVPMTPPESATPPTYTQYGNPSPTVPVSRITTGQGGYKNGGKILNLGNMKRLPKAGNGLISEITSTLNPKNWGVKDYSKSGTRDQAYAAARKAGEKEFMWNNERFSTRKDTDPIKYIGTNPNQKEFDETLRNDYPEFFKTLNRGKNVGSINFKDMVENQPNRAAILPYKTNSMIAVGENPESSKDFMSSIIAESSHLKDPKLYRSSLNPYYLKGKLEKKLHGEEVYNIPDNLEYDDHRLFEPGMALTAYGNLSPEDIKRIQASLGVEQDGYFGPQTYKALQNQYKDNYNVTNALQKHAIMYKDTDKNPISMGKDDNLSKAYLTAINNNVPLKQPEKFIDPRSSINVVYSDYALKSNAIENMDPKILQSSLYNRGYDLPKSVNSFFKFDGVVGDETKQAYNDWKQRAMKTSMLSVPSIKNNYEQQDNTKVAAPIINKSTVAPKMAVQKPGQSEALPPQFQKGGKVSSWEIIEDVPKFLNGGNTNPSTSIPVTDNTKAPSLSALEYQTKIKEGYLPFLEKNKYVSKPYVDKTISTEKGNMNCIHGVCDAISETTGKTWDSPIKTYIGNPTFFDNEEKEGYYKVDNLQETGFVIGDILQYARKKGSIGSRFPGKITPKNEKELYPNHAVLVVDKGVNEKGETYYTILNNKGETKWKDLKKSEVTEKELMSRAIKGYETYDGMLVNRYDPEYTKKNKEEREKELSILKGNNENAHYYTGNKTFNYDEENIDPVLNTKSKIKNKKVQNLVDIYNKNYNAIGKSSNLEPFILDELIKKQIGISFQETKIGEDLGIKQYIPDFAIPTLRKFSSAGDDWVEDYWRSNAFKVQEEYKTKEDFVAKLNKNKVLDKETQDWIKNHSPRSKGIFQQKELSTRGRYFDLDLSKKEDQPIASLLLAIDNYHLLSKKMPNLSPTELIDLTTLMHNAPSKALTLEFVNKYLQENNIDYVNKVNSFEKNGDFSSKKQPSLKKKEVEDIQKMFSKQNGGKTKKSNWQIIEY